MSAPADSRRWALWLTLILALTAGVYAPSFRNGYAYDDSFYVKAPNILGRDNEMVKSWQGLTKYFSTSYGEGAVSEGRGFRPITVISFAAVHQAFGTSTAPGTDTHSAAMPQHVANVLLFVLATWIMFEILSRFVGRSWPALLGTVVFGLHVVRSDPVVSIVGRSEILAFVFGGTGTLLYLAFLRRSGAMRYALLALTSLCMFLAFCSKESATAWVFFAPLTALALSWQRPELRPLVTLRKQSLPWLIAMILPAIAFAALMYPVISERFHTATLEMNPLAAEPAMWRMTSAVMVLGYALYKVVFPFFVSCDYGTGVFEVIRSLGDYRFWTSLAVLGSFLGVGLFYARRLPLLFLAVAAFFGFSFVTSNIPVAVETIFGERLLFTPAMSLSFVVALAACVLAAPARRGVRVALMILLSLWLAASVVVILRQCYDWHSDETLFLASADRHPESNSLQMNASRVHRRAGEKINFEGAEGRDHRLEWRKYTSQALQADPEFMMALDDMAVWHISYGQWWGRQGRDDKAKEHFRKAQSFLRRGFASPQFRKKVNGPILHQMQGNLHFFAGELDKALSEYRKSIEANPTQADSYRYLADFLYGQGKIEEGHRVMEEGLLKQPKSMGLREHVMRTALERKDWPAFERMLAESEELLGQKPIWAILRGRMLHARDKFGEAAKSLGAGLRNMPLEWHGYDWFYLAECLGRLDRVKEARGILERLEGSAKVSAELRGKARAKLEELGG